MIVLIRLIDLIHWAQGSFLWTPWTSKSFKIPNFLAPRSRVWIARVVEIERHFFLGKLVVTLSPVVHIKLSTAECVQFHHFRSLIFYYFTFTTLCTAPTSLSPWLVKLIRILPSPPSLPAAGTRSTPGRRAMFRSLLLLHPWPLSRWRRTWFLRYPINGRNQTSSKLISMLIMISAGWWAIWFLLFLR
jgi:hypothetical protein